MTNKIPNTCLIQNGLLMTMDSESGRSVIEDGAVLIENGKIIDCGETDGVISRHTGIRGRVTKIIQARDHIILPGLINCHTHLPMAMFRGLADDLPLDTWLNTHIFPAEATRLNPTSVKQWARHACHEMLLGGTTCCCDGYFFEDQVAEAVFEAGMRGVLGHGVIDFPAPGVPNPEENVTTAVNFVKKWMTPFTLFSDDSHCEKKDPTAPSIPPPPRITPSIFCHSPYTCSGNTLKKAKAAANKLGVLFQIHVAETKRELSAIGALGMQNEGKDCDGNNGHVRPPGTTEQERLSSRKHKDFHIKNERQGEVLPLKPIRSVVQYLDNMGLLDENTLLIHTVWIDETDMDLIRKRAAKVVHCPESNMKLASGIAPMWTLMQKGVTVGLGTDGAASNNALDLLGEMDMAAKLQKIACNDPSVMDAETVVKMATSEGAKAIGLDHLIGSIVPGKRADIILVNRRAPHMIPITNPWSAIVYSAKASDVSLVMVDGVILVEKGRVAALQS